MRTWLYKGTWPEDTGVIYMVVVANGRNICFHMDGTMAVVKANFQFERLPNSWELVA